MKCRILDLHQNVEKLANEIYPITNSIFSTQYGMGYYPVMDWDRTLKEVENVIYYILERGIHYGDNVIIGPKVIIQSYEYINIWFDIQSNEFIFELYNIKRIESEGSVMVYPLDRTSKIINHKYI